MRAFESPPHYPSGSVLYPVEQVGKRFEAMSLLSENLATKMVHFMIWTFGFSAAAAGTSISSLKFLQRYFHILRVPASL